MTIITKKQLESALLLAENADPKQSQVFALARNALINGKLKVEGYEDEKPWHKINPDDESTFPPSGKIQLWFHEGTGEITLFTYFEKNNSHKDYKNSFENYYWREVSELPPIRKFDKAFDMQFFGIDVMVVKLFSDLPFCDSYDVFLGVPEGHPFFGKKNEKIYGHNVIHTGYGIHYFPQNEKEWVDKIWWVGVNVRIEHDSRDEVLGHAFRLAKNIYEAGGGR